MNIIVVHGYLLAGTGSNQYVASLCHALGRQGHSVHLFCQEPDPAGFDFVALFEKFDSDNKRWETVFHRQTALSGQVAVVRPHLAGVLPVYVYDEYEHLIARRITEMSISDLEQYVQRNAKALAAYLSKVSVDLVISNHLIMQPIYARRAIQHCGAAARGIRHLTVIHGSALNYAVRHSNLLRQYALSTLKAADEFVLVSSHSRAEFLEYFQDVPGLPERCRVVPPGVDTDGFRPLGPDTAKDDRIAVLRRKLPRDLPDFEHSSRDLNVRRRYQRQMVASLEEEELKPDRFRELAERTRGRFSNWLTDRDAAEQLDAINWKGENIVLYFGKYLWGKGVQLLIASAPLILRLRPHTRFVLVGFGSSREILESMVCCLDQNRRRAYRRLIENAQVIDPDGGGPAGAPFAGLLQEMETPDFCREYFRAAHSTLSDRTVFTGIMNHEQLQLLVPCADVVVAPSINSEAFGLVAVEALASGVIPVLTRHSGFHDTISLYSHEFADLDPDNRINSLCYNRDLIFNLADNILALLHIYEGLTPEDRTEIRRRAHRLAAYHFSWDEVGQRLARPAGPSAK